VSSGRTACSSSPPATGSCFETYAQACRWTFPEDWDEPHHLDVAVAVLGDTDPEAVATRSERLTFWPFRYEALERDLAAAGFAVESSTFTPDAERYLVTARRSR